MAACSQEGTAEAVTMSSKCMVDTLLDPDGFSSIAEFPGFRCFLSLEGLFLSQNPVGAPKQRYNASNQKEAT